MTKVTAKTRKKATIAKKKASRKKTSTSANRKAAAKKHAVLAAKLREDLKATKETLKAVKESANAEIAVLKSHLAAAMKREAELQKIGEKKVREMVAAGEKWEKAQITRIKKIVAKSPPKKKARKKK